MNASGTTSVTINDPAQTVGQAVPQLEGGEKLNGSAQYVADLYRPGMLHGAILQSHLPHARIKSYDLRAALALRVFAPSSPATT